LFAVALAFVGIGCLIFFIHHIASSIQAERIIQSAANETIDAIDRLFPAEMGEATGADISPGSEPPPGVQVWQSIPARRTGYIQGVDSDGLLGFAGAQNTVVRMERGIGDFVVEGAPLVSVAGGKQPDDETAAHLDALYAIGRQRTMAQDVGFGIRQIVDVALKALSPGINDTTTAVTCVDYLTAVLARLATRQFESPHRMDEGELRVIARGSTFPGMLGEAFDQIRQNAAGNVKVLLSLLQACRSTDDANIKQHHKRRQYQSRNRLHGWCLAQAAAIWFSTGKDLKSRPGRGKFSFRRVGSDRHVVPVRDAHHALSSPRHAGGQIGNFRLHRPASVPQDAVSEAINQGTPYFVFAEAEIRRIVDFSPLDEAIEHHLRPWDRVVERAAVHLTLDLGVNRRDSRLANSRRWRRRNRFLEECRSNISQQGHFLFAQQLIEGLNTGIATTG
jgi:hypothetical protein